MQGGNLKFSITGSGATRQVKAEINYPQPISLPGLQGVWNLVAGGNFTTQLLPLGNGAAMLNFNLLPYVNLQSKCSTGFGSPNSPPRQANSVASTWP